ncbi:MAG: hypothetical protein JWO22_1227 [Frankiales bacterium]|nr:hypothetical protein [Frankiales bacterium]
MSADFDGYRPRFCCLNPYKMKSTQVFHPASDVAMTNKGLPAIPEGRSETPLSRWDFVIGGKPASSMFVEIDDQGRGAGNADHGPLRLREVFAGDAKCLLTDKALRIAAYSGSVLNFGKLGVAAILGFTIPLAEVTNVDAGRSNPVYTARSFVIECRQLGAGLEIGKACTANEQFSSSVFATNKIRDFATDLTQALASLRPQSEDVKGSTAPSELIERYCDNRECDVTDALTTADCPGCGLPTST